jgi:hypothetical protein
MFFKMVLDWCQSSRLFPNEMNLWTYWQYIRGLESKGLDGI